MATGYWQAEDARVVLQPGIALDSSRRAIWRDRSRSYLLLSGLVLLLALGALLAQVMLRSVRAARDEGTRAALGETAGGRIHRHLSAAVHDTVPTVLGGGALGFAAMFPLLRSLESMGAGWIAQLFDPLNDGIEALRVTLLMALIAAASVAGLTVLLSAPSRAGFDRLRSPFRRHGSMLLPLACLVTVAACVAALAAASARHTILELASALEGLPANVSFSTLSFTRDAATAHLMARQPTTELILRLAEVDASIALASSSPAGPPAMEELITAGGRAAVFVNYVTPNYFTLLRIPLRGRTLRPQGGEAVVSDRFATEHLGPGDPVGRALRIGSVLGGDHEVMVVGVVPDTHSLSPRGDAVPLLYLAATEVRHVQAALSPARSAGAMQAALSDVLSRPGVRVAPPRPLRSLAEDAFAIERIEAWVLAGQGLACCCWRYTVPSLRFAR